MSTDDEIKNNSQEVESEEEKKKNLVKCPFCLNKFDRRYTYFKIKEVLKEQDMSSDDEEAFMEKDDEIYKKFWEQFPGSEAYQNANEGKQAEKMMACKNNPIILPCIAKGKNMGEETKDYLTSIKDVLDKESGIVLKVTDSRGNETDIRICNVCHNPLPKEYGKYPIKFISVIGITSSGKTVYLSQLMLNIVKNILLNAGLNVLGQTPTEIDDFIKRNLIGHNCQLPGSTPGEVFIPPLPLTVENQDGKKYTLIFYDIAGENCVDQDQLIKFGKFVKNADGIIYVVDPVQLSEVFLLNELGEVQEEKVDKNVMNGNIRPDEVLRAMYDAFGIYDDAGADVPLAVAISKSDLLDGIKGMRVDSNIFANIDYSKYKREGGRRGFSEEDYMGIYEDIKELFNKSESVQAEGLVRSLQTCFPNYGFFAFSSLGPDAKAENGRLSSEPAPRRIEEPLFWLLYNLDVIDKAERPAEENNQSKRRLFGFRKNKG